MQAFAEYFWRLLPANPILLRVVAAASRRKRDLAVRCGYLGVLIFIVCFFLATGTTGVAGMSLRDLQNASVEIFRSMSYVQLALVALLAPVFTAGAITQEKDSQTYDILLATPLSNGQIVLGSLMSRLFFVVALLVSGIPVFAVTQIFGGVSINNIANSFLIAAATAFVTGAMAMAIATFKVGTRRTIFSFYLFIVIYLVGIFLLDKLAFFRIDGPLIRGTQSHAQISWFTGIHPFLALRTILHDPTYLPPDTSQLPEHLRRWPIGWYLTSPHGFYITVMFLLSAMLVIPSILLLRRMAQSTTTLKGLILQKLRMVSGDRTRKPRGVWTNPIAWREARTKGSATRATLLRYGFILSGIGGAVVLLAMFASAGKMPDKYITAGSYDPVQQTLFIHGDATYGISPNTAVLLNDAGVSIDTLHGRFEVSNLDVRRTAAGTSEIRSLTLGAFPRRIDPQLARSLLLGAVLVEFAAILLIVTNASASTVTREKEDGSLDLLLSTPITSRYYIWGKLRGLVSFMLPMAAVPVASVALFVGYDLWRLIREPYAFQWIVHPEALLVLPATLVLVVALAAILGMQLSLRCRTTVRAVMSSVGVMIGTCFLLGWCGYGLVDSASGNPVSLFLAAFSPFTVPLLLIDPHIIRGSAFTGYQAFGSRLVVFLGSMVATASYAALVWVMYRSMVKNFDMTIRRQSR